MKNKLIEAELHRDAAIEVADKFLKLEEQRGSPVHTQVSMLGISNRCDLTADKVASSKELSPLQSLQELTKLSHSKFSGHSRRNTPYSSLSPSRKQSTQAIISMARDKCSDVPSHANSSPTVSREEMSQILKKKYFAKHLHHFSQQQTKKSFQRAVMFCALCLDSHLMIKT